MKKVIFMLLAVAMMSNTASAQLFKKKKKAVNEEKTEQAAYDKAAAKKGDGKHFGETITADNAMSCGELLKKMDGLTADSKGIETKVKGTVMSVCQNKGCWMKISPEGGGKSVFVKFKDYGFFMPMDLAGSQVVMQGRAYISETPVAELRHYAEDAGKTKEEIEKITEPAKDYKFTATGVVILDK